MTDPAAAQDLSPAMRQFHAVKQRHPDCIVFFRIGDFYELFYDDAKTASRVLGLTLTARSKGDNAVPMAGVPFHAVESYLARMLEAGFRVAVVEQLEDPKAAKGVIKRDVVRLITPGTLTDETLLKDNKPATAPAPASLGSNSAPDSSSPKTLMRKNLATNSPASNLPNASSPNPNTPPRPSPMTKPNPRS